MLVVMNDWIHAAHSLTKTSTTAVQTFMSPVRGLVGVALLRQERLLHAPAVEAHDEERVRHLAGDASCRAWTSSSPTPTCRRDLIDAAVANGAKGIVIAGVGNGNMNKAVGRCGRRRP